MLSQSKSIRLRFVVSMCMVLAAGAVSMGTSCITSPKGKGAGAGGTINGTVDSASTGAPIGAGVTVTATDSVGATYIGTTASNGTYSITGVPKGPGTLLLSNLPTGCPAPAALDYTVQNNGGMQTININVSC
jgi:hypothetical protein